MNVILVYFIAAIVSLVISERRLLLIWKVSFGIQPSFALLLGVSLSEKHGGHSSGLSRGILIVTFCLAETLG